MDDDVVEHRRRADDQPPGVGDRPGRPSRSPSASAGRGSRSAPGRTPSASGLARGGAREPLACASRRYQRPIAALGGLGAAPPTRRRPPVQLGHGTPARRAARPAPGSPPSQTTPGRSRPSRGVRSASARAQATFSAIQSRCSRITRSTSRSLIRSGTTTSGGLPGRHQDPRPAAPGPSGAPVSSTSPPPTRSCLVARRIERSRIAARADARRPGRDLAGRRRGLPGRALRLGLALAALRLRRRRGDLGDRPLEVEGEGCRGRPSRRSRRSGRS